METPTSSGNFSTLTYDMGAEWLFLLCQTNVQFKDPGLLLAYRYFESPYIT